MIWPQASLSVLLVLALGWCAARAGSEPDRQPRQKQASSSGGSGHNRPRSQNSFEQQPQQETLNVSASNNLGDLVAIGGISFIDPVTGLPRRTITAAAAAAKDPSIDPGAPPVRLASTVHFNVPQQQQQQQTSPTSGRLIDRIAIPATGEENNNNLLSLEDSNSNSLSGQLTASAATTASRTKLDYIIDFMRANKLTKFCDLFFPASIASSSIGMTEELKKQLNSLPQFTLFVPTNEAFQLLPGQLLASLQDDKTPKGLETRRRFLLAHATGELIVPKFIATSVSSRPTTNDIITSTSGDQQREDYLRGESSGLSASKLLPQQSSARWSSGRSRERLSAPTSVSLAFSLAGGQLRVITAPLIVQAHNGSTKLELLVNGANVLSGHSHALQEPNNSSATYAIVHLIDRPLYPGPRETLMELIDQKSSQFGKLIRLSRDTRLIEMLEQADPRLLTVFLPSDEALRLAPSKLFDQLETNSTYLREFLRSHLVEGIYYSGQLLLPPATGGGDTSRVRLLSALSGQPLELESKSLSGRDLLLVNSIPIIEQDLVALNGVVHLLARPIQPTGGACPCEQTTVNNNNNNNTNSLAIEVLAPQASTRLEEKQRTGLDSMTSNWFRNEPGAKPAGEQLEREELQQQQQQQQQHQKQREQRVRAQRSGSLVARNNQDFYRPSTAPVNLLLEQPASEQLAAAGSINSASSLSSASSSSLDSSPAGRRQDSQPGPSMELGVSPTAPSADLFDAERYKVVLNAATRQRLRDEQQLSSLSQNQSGLSPNQFAYDRPMSLDSTTVSSNNNKLRYSSLPTAATPERNHSSAHVDQVLGASSQQRAQRLLKFQVEDARDQISPGPQVQPNGRKSLASPPAYDLIVNQSPRQQSLERQQQQQQQQKQLLQAPSQGCAFYDAECKRLLAGSRLVRLPPTANKQRLVNNIQSGQQQRSPAFGTITQAPQMFDSTFGETTTSSPGQLQQQQQHSQHNNHHQQITTPLSVASSSNKLAAQTRGQLAASSLAQPLPPWDSRDDLRRDQLQQQQEQQLRQLATVPSSAASWPRDTFNSSPSTLSASSKSSSATNLGDLARIRYQQQQESSSSKSPLSVGRNLSTMQAVQPNAQILLVPVKMFQDASSMGPLVPSNGSVKFSSAREQLSLQRQSALAPSTALNIAKQQEQQLQSGRLSNLSAYDSFDDLPKPSQFGAANRLRLSANSLQDSLLLNSNQPARKIVRLHTMGPPSSSGSGFDDESSQSSSPNRFQPTSGGDISVTSALLQQQQQTSKSIIGTHISNNNNNDQLLTAANQRFALQQQDQSNSEFFQNRTIAEIMEDSGLRIDGQQVTFNRLRECLERADLLSLVASQTSSSSSSSGGGGGQSSSEPQQPTITLFMPTDFAFQRLVQQQAIMQQQQTRAVGSRLSARLTDPMRRHMLPLIARPMSGSTNLDSNGRLQMSATSSSNSLEPPASDTTLALSSRLTLDCSSPQVRQLLLDHLSGQFITPKQLQQDATINTLNGRKLILSSVPQKKIVVVDGQPVIAATRAKNGMVYVINKFLNISEQLGSVADLIERQPQLSTLHSYLTFSSLADRLKRESGPITVLAPTNEAFEQLSTAARQLINSDPSALADILRGHIVEGAQFGKLISMRPKLKTMNADQTIEAKVIKPNIYQLDNQLTSMRLVGTTGNGVVNAIDRLIVPTWLRVSMGTGSASNQSLFASSSTTRGSAGRSLFEPDNSLSLANHLEPSSGSADSGRPSLRSSSPSSSNTNLPSLNSQPLRFEQPNGSLLRATNTFNLATGNSSSDNFESSLSNINSFDTLRNATSRTAASLFNSSPLDVTNLITTTNRTKNMQLIEKLATLMKARKFAKYLLKSKLSEQLKPDMNYVILVPTDQAVDRLPRQIMDSLERDSDRLADLINFHVIDTTFEFINTIPDGHTLNTLNEKDILFNWHRNNTILTASGAVVLGGIQEENIALLIVDRVLYPTPGDLLSIVSKSPILSNFTSLLRNAKFEQQLSLAGPYTLFAPSDFAFNQLDRRDFEFLQRNKDTARRFLLRHLCQPAIFTSSIALSNSTESPAMRASTSNSRQTTGNIAQAVPNLQVTNSLGEELTLRQKNDYFSVNDVNFSYADVAATNGVVHVIDGLL